jgi:hypothetical protein
MCHVQAIRLDPSQPLAHLGTAQVYLAAGGEVTNVVSELELVLKALPGEGTHADTILDHWVLGLELQLLVHETRAGGNDGPARVMIPRCIKRTHQHPHPHPM